MRTNIHVTLKLPIEREIPKMCCFLYLVPAWSELSQLVQNILKVDPPLLSYATSIKSNRTGIGIITRDKSGDKNGHVRVKVQRYRIHQ